MNRPRMVATLMLLLSFGLGGLTGMALEEGLGLDWFDFLDEDSRGGVDPVLSGLGLTDSQQAQIDEIFEAQEERLEEYWEARIPEMTAIVAASYEQVRLLLSDEQRATFNMRMQEHGLPLPRDPD